MTILGRRYRGRSSGPAKAGPTVIGESYILNSGSEGPIPGHQDPLIYRMRDVAGDSIYYSTLERCEDFVNPGPPYLSGDNFTLLKSTVQDLTIQGTGAYKSSSSDWGYVTHYDGGFVYTGGGAGAVLPLVSTYRRTGQFTADDAPNIPDLSSYGPTVYNSMRPKLEKASVAQMIGEARDFMPMMRQTSKGFHDLWKGLGGKGGSASLKPFMSPKRLADEFLGHQFGWKPFVQDMSQIIDTYQNSVKYMDQIRKDNNVWKKRYRVVEKQEDISVLGQDSTWSVYPANIRILYCCEAINDTNCLNTYTKKVTNLIWGVGSFKYYRPEYDPSLANYASAFAAAQRYMTLYGANVNPSVLYKVTPWTWLVDWFTNVGATISNASSMATDAAVSKYAFVMAHYTDEIQIQSELFLRPRHARCDWSRIIETKHRETCSPFGFGLRPGDLSGKQIAILGALGLSKFLP